MSLASLVTTIETDVADFVHKEIAAGEKWMHSFTPVLEADATQVWTQFKPIILGLIAAAEQVGLQYATGGIPLNKLGMVVTGLVAAAGTQGIKVAEATAATVVQQAVTSIANSAQAALK